MSRIDTDYYDNMQAKARRANNEAEEAEEAEVDMDMIMQASVDNKDTSVICSYGICKCKKCDHVGSPSPEKSRIYHDVEKTLNMPSDVVTIGTLNHSNGQISSEKTFVGNNQMGDWAYYDKFGKIKAAGIYRNGKPIKNISYYSYMNKPACVMITDRKKQTVYAIILDITGKSLMYVTHKIGRDTENRKTVMQREWWSNGNLKSETPSYYSINYRNSRMEYSDCNEFCVSRKWRNNGQLEKETYYFAKNSKWSYSVNWKDGKNVILYTDGSGVTTEAKQAKFENVSSVEIEEQCSNTKSGTVYIVTSDDQQISYKYTKEGDSTICSDRYTFHNNGRIATFHNKDDKRIYSIDGETQLIISGFNVTYMYNGVNISQFVNKDGYISGKVTMGGITTNYEEPSKLKLSMKYKTEEIQKRFTKYDRTPIYICDQIFYGYKHGELVERKEDGAIVRSANYVGNLQHGEFKWYNPDSTYSMTETWNYGKLEIRKKYQKNEVVEQTINGMMTRYEFGRVTSTIINGKKNGMCYEYYDDGIIKRSCEYINDMKHGVETNQNSIGNVTTIANWQLDKLHGALVTYNNIGLIIKTETYIKGKCKTGV
jgi:antitoxin component YwqK of YwqJK toxin-antitoxin module